MDKKLAKFSHFRNNYGNLKILKILVAVSPAVFIVLFTLFRGPILEETPPTLADGLSLAAIALFAVFFYKVVLSLIKRTREENIRLNRELDILNEIALTVNESLNLKKLLPHTMEKLIRLTEADSGELFLINEEDRELHQALCVTATTKVPKTKSDSLANTHELVSEVTRSNEPIIIRDTKESGRVFPSATSVAGFRSITAVPLKSRSGIVGVFLLFSHKPGYFKSGEMTLLTNIGSQIAVAVENARLYEKVQGVVIVEERERIAKELHDGLAQILGYVITKSEATRQILNRMTLANDYLLELENVAQDVYTDTREDILGLRTAISGDRDMVSALREYLTRFGQMHGIKVVLEVGDQTVPRLPPHVELQAIRIVQEALSNIRKHAEPTRALVGVVASENEVVLIVEDDGKGFDINELEQISHSKFGIRTIKERANSIRGRLNIESEPGHGTKVKLSIPLNLTDVDNKGEQS